MRPTFRLSAATPTYHRCLASPTCLRFRPNTRRAFRVCSSKRPLPASRVTTRTPGCIDVIRDGWNGFVVPPRSARDLADPILELLRDRDKAHAMGDRAAELARREYKLE